MAEQQEEVGSTARGYGLGLGAWAVFLASISTILGAILFLRFGYAVAHTGLAGAIGVILLGHLVTIPTALAVSEIATNRRVAGGGAYFIISRSFGPGIGGAIGIALYLSQAISIAFYLVAFAEAFAPVYAWLLDSRGLTLDPRLVSFSTALVLMVLVTARGANLGVSTLKYVSAALGLSLAAFLFGSAPESVRPEGIPLTSVVADADSFAIVFAVCFPAFTGIIAGLGLSGDLRRPQQSIPRGTLAATVVGMLIYLAAAVKLAASATPEVLAEDPLIMAQIAVWGPAIFIGLGAAALSSALGSILVAPRTLQALARDGALPAPGLNRWLQKGRGAAMEPVAATVFSGVLAAVFLLIGELDFIARILTMFFLVTYGALCTVSFLEYFAGNPSYRPTFRSRWYVSLLGAVMCAVIMLQLSVVYALASFLVMGLIYLWVNRGQHGQRDLQTIFRDTLFQLTRRMQITLQRERFQASGESWRPAIIALTRFGEQRFAQFDLLRWFCHRQGFGQFVQFIEGQFTPASSLEAKKSVSGLIARTAVSRAGVFVDTLISPSYHDALGQTLQMPGVSGLPNNCVLFEFDGRNPTEIQEVADGARLAEAAEFSVLVLRSAPARFGYRSSIHVWITEDTLDSAPMTILLAYILVGHPEWKRATISVFACVSPTSEDRSEDFASRMAEWRLPIASHNVTTLVCENEEALETQVVARSRRADLVIAPLHSSHFEVGGLELSLLRYQGLQDTLFVNTARPASIV